MSWFGQRRTSHMGEMLNFIQWTLRRLKESFHHLLSTALLQLCFQSASVDWLIFEPATVSSSAGPKTAQTEMDCTQSTCLRDPAPSAPVNVSAPAPDFPLTRPPTASPRTLPTACPTLPTRKWHLSTTAWKTWLWRTSTETCTDIMNTATAETGTGRQVEQLERPTLSDKSIALGGQDGRLVHMKVGCMSRTKASCLSCVIILVALVLYKGCSRSCPSAAAALTVHTVVILAQNEEGKFSAKPSHVQTWHSSSTTSKIESVFDCCLRRLVCRRLKEREVVAG